MQSISKLQLLIWLMSPDVAQRGCCLLQDGQPAVGAASPTPPAMTPDQAAKAAITPQDTWSEWHAQTLQMRQNAARRNAKVAGRARAAQAGSTVELPQHFAAVQQAVLSGTGVLMIRKLLACIHSSSVSASACTASLHCWQANTI